MKYTPASFRPSS